MGSKFVVTEQLRKDFPMLGEASADMEKFISYADRLEAETMAASGSEGDITDSVKENGVHLFANFRDLSKTFKEALQQTSDNGKKFNNGVDRTEQDNVDNANKSFGG
ncbi:hypothetical protein SAMN05216215_1007253 [Saccharopolyspora shandongensis]|uniref:Excreted virulence factor EspC, type VII ESX diderm n=1 Tax=Saccharopolyspora shandongensis TaxID=418495 RepID=A0A1H2Z2S4_9PSEU|nr:hypothetical protein [Saccharopolyspora shandongensis]SDX11676.1 hypothetical protein SAMN05216215_1007253 [Saccharopolyspora shandongensis]